MKFIVTYIFVHIIYGITGFKYDIFKDTLGIKTLIDLVLWIGAYYIVSFIVKIYKKRNKETLDN
ncbi:hypothetical protein SDC9_177598 [bioreactor metagenome]|uniref:Uncharacterized protein n=1 Tax=bioreactor metagenome TaxID=1076179 RepID=A0A645GUX2_9ZZZZ